MQYLPLSNQQSKTSVTRRRTPRPVLEGIVTPSTLKKNTIKNYDSHPFIHLQIYSLYFLIQITFTIIQNSNSGMILSEILNKSRSGLASCE